MHNPSAGHELAALQPVRRTGRLLASNTMAHAAPQASMHASVRRPHCHAACCAARTLSRRTSATPQASSCRSARHTWISAGARLLAAVDHSGRCGLLRSQRRPAAVCIAATTDCSSCDAATAQLPATLAVSDSHESIQSRQQRHPRPERQPRQAAAGQPQRRSVLAGLAAAPLAAIQLPQVH